MGVTAEAAAEDMDFICDAVASFALHISRAVARMRSACLSVIWFRAVGSKKKNLSSQISLWDEGWCAKHAIIWGGLGACSPRKIFENYSF